MSDRRTWNYHNKYGPAPTTEFVAEKPFLVDARTSSGELLRVARCRLCGFAQTWTFTTPLYWWRGTSHYCVRGSIKRVMWTIDKPGRKDGQ